MPSSTPPPGRSGAPRRGMGGLVGLLAVLAFVILAAVIVTRRVPEPVAAVPPPSTAAPAPPDTTLAAPPSEAPPATEPASAVASASPAAETAVAPPANRTPRAPRGSGPPSTADATRTADSGLPARRAPGSLPAPGVSPRRFVLGTTSIESLKPVERDLKGFDPANVGVKRAPEVNGRVELEMDPATVRPGVDYTVKVYFANDGGKDIPVEEMKVSTVEDGKSASRTVTPAVRSVRPKQRVLLSEFSGVWREAARSWTMDVVVTSGRQDVYRNRLRWE